MDLAIYHTVTEQRVTVSHTDEIRAMYQAHLSSFSGTDPLPEQEDGQEDDEYLSVVHTWISDNTKILNFLGEHDVDSEEVEVTSVEEC